MTWVATYATLVLALIWSRHVQLPYLIPQIATWLMAGVLLLRVRASRRVRRLLFACLALLGLSLAVQLFTTWRLGRLSTDWPQVVAAREANMRSLLDRSVGSIVDRSRGAAIIASQGAATVRDTAALFRRLEVLRQRSKVDALAVFGEQGELIAWAG
ncbi:MAG TPA: hypothetical protein VF021_11200, partial [Longimicrobiales bacterium]